MSELTGASELQEATKEFLIESHENLDQLDADLLDLEKSAAPADALGRIFRTLHTIKGSCSFLGFPHLEAVAHAGEDLLGKMRDGRIIVTPAVTEALLRVVDTIRGLLGRVESTGTDGQEEHRDLIALLTQLTANPPESGTLVTSPESAARERSVLRQDFTLAEGVSLLAAESTAPASGTADASQVYDSSVRIHVDLLDKLMTIAGEIVLARNQILQYSQHQEDASFQNTCRQLNLITTELQEHVMKTRLLPIGNVWSRFPRLVHDTARACGKRVRLETEGAETELDKTLIEAVRDPLTHLVRNAIDHGIEQPELRRAAGKPEEGCVWLRAYHEGGQVNVEVSDDGGGIDPERIKSRAIEHNLITAEQAGKLSAQSLMGLIFLPGFSTAPTVTTLSGRGVGMDVVKTNIEKIGGSVDVHSTVGKGTVVRVRIPLTLAIIKVLVVTSAGDRYAIPQVSLLELVRLEGERATRGIEHIQGAPVYRLRGSLLPLVYLRRQFQSDPALAPGSVGSGDAGDRGEVNIVVLQADDRPFGLVVDSIHDTEEIVVKPLQKQLKGISVFAGATIMGDGKVALILDVLGLAQKAKVVTGVRQRTPNDEATDAPGAAVDRQTVLLCAVRRGGRIAIPLASVDRLEEFPRSAVERVGHQHAVQYRGEILPLLRVARVLGRRRSSDARRPDRKRKTARRPAALASGHLQVVVVAGLGERVGLIVDRILDIADETLAARSRARRAGVSFTAVIQGRVTEVLDLEHILRWHQQDAVEPPALSAAEA